MDLRAADGVALRFHAYIEHLSKALGHVDRRGIVDRLGLGSAFNN
jgi:hypothetical protein